MRRILATAVLLALPIGCTATGGVTSPTPSSVCQAIANAQANPTVIATLGPQVASNSAVGQVWQYAQSGCVGNQPAAGVNATWTQAMLTMLEQALPVVLPILVGMI